MSAQGLGQISLGGWLFTKARGSRPTLGKQGWVLLVLFCFVLNVSSSDFEKKKKNGGGSWKSLKHFHSNYPKQLDGVY